jgi:integrase
MPLTDVRIRQTKPGEKPIRMADGGGLFLEIRPNGSKLWRYAFRLGGKQNLFAIGSYPELSLQQARSEHGKARELVREGLNPSHARASARAEATAVGADTFKAVAEDWFAEASTKWNPEYVKQVRRYLEGDIYPAIGKRATRVVSSADILLVLRKVEKRGPAAAILCRQIISQVYSYAIQNLRADFDPTQPLRHTIKRKPTVHADAKDPVKIGAMLAAIKVYTGTRPVTIALRLLLLTFVRTAELRGARWVEFDFKTKVWNIPAQRMKMRRRHLVPLSEQVIALLEELQTITGNSKFLFPNQRDPRKFMANSTVNRAYEYMGFPTGDVTGHDMRATASTHLHEQGFRSEVVEIQMAHAKKDRVAAAYNHAQYLPERIVMMQAWADFLDALPHATPPERKPRGRRAPLPVPESKP